MNLKKAPLDISNPSQTGPVFQVDGDPIPPTDEIPDNANDYLRQIRKPPSPSTHLQPTLEWENAFLCQFVKIRTAFALFRQHYYTYDKFESINLPTQFPSLSQITDSINPNSSQDPIYTILSSIDPTILSLTSLPAPPRENLPMGVNEDLSEGDEPIESNNEGEQTDEEQSDIDTPLPTSNQPTDQDHSTTNKPDTAKLPPILFNSPTTSSLLKMSQKSINGNVICLVEYSAHHDITLSIQHIFRVKIVQKHPHHQPFKIQKKTENSRKVEQIEQLGNDPTNSDVTISKSLRFDSISHTAQNAFLPQMMHILSRFSADIVQIWKQTDLTFNPDCRKNDPLIWTFIDPH
ncbi:hypothetical protein BLNAU_3750 [Blattamonas nauphoetae]|uniref:Uncharacterized protein n=1 Tax=Blattamonas nauphoetae TaxID=2049346 RepID=A0ABQ9YC39_9EUKA|nr:hypothetical protein BLNAU_3750 [Blattamonas nauphoetae]